MLRERCVSAMKRREKARELFLSGYNCSQSVLGAFCDVMGMDFSMCMRLASPFGGGVARMRHICGTVSASLMVIGITRGYEEHDARTKSEHYAFVQEFAKKFQERNGSIICRELLDLRCKAGKIDNGSSPNANERSEEYYRVRPCLSIIEDAVDLLCGYLSIDDEIS